VRYRQQRHHTPVAKQESRGRAQLLPRAEADDQEACHRVGQRNALQYTRDAGVEQPVRDTLEEGGVRITRYRSPGVSREPREQQAEQEYDRAAPEYLPREFRHSMSPGPSRLHGEHGGDAHDEEAPGEDQVRWSPAVPLRVPERRVDR